MTTYNWQEIEKGEVCQAFAKLVESWDYSEAIECLSYEKTRRVAVYDMFITHSPCKMCALDIIDAGIKRVVFKNQYRDTTGIQLLKEHGIIVEQLVDNVN